MRTCPDCGESCAQVWCGFCEKLLPLEKGCAFGQCEDPECWLCVGMALKFRTVRCAGEVEGRACRLVVGHRGVCLPRPQSRAKEAHDTDKRDGKPTMFARRRGAKK